MGDRHARELCHTLGEDGDTLPFSQLDATVGEGKVRPGHGLQVDITARVEIPLGHSGAWWWRDAQLDVHGSRLFAALPHGLGSVAQMTLPVKAIIDTDDAEVHVGGTWKGSIIFGAKQLSRGRLDSTLADIVAAGDPQFVVELRHRSSQLICLLPTRASLIQKGLLRPHQVSVRDDGPLGDFRKSKLRLVAGYLRWWLMPLLFIVASWSLSQRPEQILPHLPALMLESNLLTEQVGVNAVLPPHPESMAEAFRLGAIHAQMQQMKLAEAEGGQATTVPLQSMQSLMREAALVLGDRAANRIITAEDMDAMLDEIVRIEAHVGVVYRILGFFTFVNTVWLFAILGISISIGPAVYHLLKPLHDAFRKLLRWLYFEIILPNVQRAHRWGLFEVFAWVGCWAGLAQGMLVTSAPDVAEMIALTASGLTIPALGYTTVLRGKRVSNDWMATLFQLFFAVGCFPWALHYHSTLYGYCVVVAIYGAMGFGVWAGHLCVAIGFHSKEAMHRVCATSLLLVGTFVSLTAAGVQPELLAPFSSAVSVFGSVMLFLSLLIISSNPWNHSSTRTEKLRFGLSRWAYANLLMLFTLLVLNAAGRTFGLVGMANTSTTFLCLWLLDKYVDFHVDMKWNGWVLVLLVSCVAWRASLWLHAHPGHIVSMFSGI